MKIKLSKKQWEFIGKQANWQDKAKHVLPHPASKMPQLVPTMAWNSELDKAERLIIELKRVHEELKDEEYPGLKDKLNPLIINLQAIINSERGKK